MKKLVIVIVLICSCKSSDLKNTNEIYQTLCEEIYFKYSVPKKIKDNGVGLIQYEDNSYFIKFLSNRNIIGEEFSPDILDFQLNSAFNNEQLESYISQLNSKNFVLDKDVNFKNKKIRKFNELKNQMRHYDYYKVYVTQPLYSKDKKIAIIFSSSGDFCLMNLFEFYNKKWNYIASYNTISPLN
jgi:hypothetical protein